MSRKRRVLSPPAVAILRRFLDDPQSELYGFQIIRETGIPSSTLYPALRTLAEERRLLVSRWEDIDPATEGRPARRLYRLDGAAAPSAREAVCEHIEHQQELVKRRLLKPRLVEG